MFDKIVGQLIKQRGVAGRVRITKVVKGLNDATPNQLGPDPVDFNTGEHWVGGLCQPRSENLAAVDCRGGRWR